VFVIYFVTDSVRKLFDTLSFTDKVSLNEGWHWNN